MKVILGLGNPGAEYVLARHNAGVMLVDEVFSRQSIVVSNGYGWRKKKNIIVAKFPDVILVKTGGFFMNESGEVIKEFWKNSSYPLENFYLAHDDLDIKFGEYKIQFGVGPKCHNGVESVENELHTQEFWRIRIGIDNRPSFTKASEGKDYVLQKFSKEEKEVLDGVLEKICDEIIETNT